MLGMASTTLTERELAMLALEQLWWKYPGAKEARILEEFGLSTNVYYQQLGALIDRDEALAHDPLLVKRLRRIRDKRKRSRSITHPSIR